jgi:ArsR family transcriptional regulator
MREPKVTKEMTEVFNLQAELCKSLADPKRLMILHMLRGGPRSVNELAEMLRLKQSNTSQHLAVLRNAGLITPQRQGNAIYYSLANPSITTACDLVREIISERLQRNQSLANMM